MAEETLPFPSPEIHQDVGATFDITVQARDAVGDPLPVVDSDTSFAVDDSSVVQIVKDVDTVHCTALKAGTAVITCIATAQDGGGPFTDTVTVQVGAGVGLLFTLTEPDAPPSPTPPAAGSPTAPKAAK